ncbi:Fe-S cluster assembly protein SufD [Microcystis sp.]|uniref:Fe-S cluster assembly protein SufD n=1 Tax=Microcystis sp. TaxID=1127 RepID=UPI003919FC5F
MTAIITKPEQSGELLLKLSRETVPTIDNGKILELRESGASKAQELAIPGRKDEEWQFTDLSQLWAIDFRAPQTVTIDKNALAVFLLPEAKNSRLVFVNGIYQPELSDISALPPGVSVGNLANAQKDVLVNYLGKEKTPEFFTALNQAGLSDGAVIHVTANTVVTTPIHLLFITVVEEIPRFYQPHSLIVAETGASVNIIENYGALAEHCSDLPVNYSYFTNAVTEIYLEANAEVIHTRVQRESGDGFHIGRTIIEQAHDSRYTLNEINLGAKLCRHNLDILQKGEQTETNLHGLAMITGQQTADTHSAIYLNHPHGIANQLHKCIVDGSAHAIFNGKVFVPKPAQLTNASQLNRNLLISNKARVNTKPELQITADNVKCSHGATISQLEADDLFYLQSRGLSADTARSLLIDAFSAEILAKIPLESLRQRLGQCVACRSVE